MSKPVIPMSDTPWAGEAQKILAYSLYGKDYPEIASIMLKSQSEITRLEKLLFEACGWITKGTLATQTSPELRDWFGAARSQQRGKEKLDSSAFNKP